MRRYRAHLHRRVELRFLVNTQLGSRVLWYDGTSQVSPELVPDLLLIGVPPELLAVDSLNEDVQQFNSLADQPITVGKTENRQLDFTWKIPAEHQNLEVKSYLRNRLDDFKNNPLLSPERLHEYSVRLEEELVEIETRGMEPLMRALIYIVSRLEETKTVWGVGRGSSCASLALFLIGLHKVDPIKFKIPMSEFFHD